MKIRRSAAVGTVSSFWANFTPSATSCAQPWNPPAYIGPSRDCMCAMTLCSAWPTRSGRVRNATEVRTIAMTSRMRAPPRGNTRREVLTAAGSPAAAPARFLRARPGLGDPRGQDEVLAQRVALEPVGQQQRLEVRVTFEDDSEHLEGLAFVPVRAAVDPGRGGQNRLLARGERTDQDVVP